MLGFLVVSDQDGPALGKPGQGALYYPSSGGMLFLTPLISLLLTNPADVPLIAIGRNHLMPSGMILGLIETQVLRRLCSGIRSFHYDGRKGRCQKFGVMDVGSSHYHAQGASRGLNQQAALAPSFTPIRGIATNQVPPKRAFPKAVSTDCHSQSILPNSAQRD